MYQEVPKDDKDTKHDLEMNDVDPEDLDGDE
jgi:hypothetical protein